MNYQEMYNKIIESYSNDIDFINFISNKKEESSIQSIEEEIETEKIKLLIETLKNLKIKVLKEHAEKEIGVFKK